MKPMEEKQKPVAQCHSNSLPVAQCHSNSLEPDAVDHIYTAVPTSG